MTFRARCTQLPSADSKKAPPFAQLLHLVHLTGSSPTKYLIARSTYKSDCMSCPSSTRRRGDGRCRVARKVTPTSAIGLEFRGF